MLWQPESSRLEDYLQCTNVINFDDPGIVHQAERLVSQPPQAAEDKLIAIAAAFDFVRDSTPHSCDIQSRAVSRRASEVLRNKEGMCYAKAFLLAAFLRLWNIPCGLVYQRLFRGGRHLLHGMNAVWLEEKGCWVVIDARGMADGSKVFFNPEKPGDVFVFTVNSDLGECTYPTIYCAPLPCIVDVLYRYNSCAEMACHLSSEIVLETGDRRI